MDQEVRESSRSPGWKDSSETVIAIEANGANEKPNETLPNKAVIEDEDACSSCSINIEDGDDVVGRVCRICHLSAKENGKSSGELMELGCGCKGELGGAHSHCAEAWFRVKGNRLCEICGEAARNIRGVSDNGFMEEWKERSNMDSGNDINSSTSDGCTRCLQGQPLCNLLMSFLVLAFVLPWFFRVNMF